MKVLLREATISDLELILAWRLIPDVYQGLYTQSKENRPLTWDEHYNWWMTRKTWKIFIIQVNDGKWTRDVGYVNIGQLDSWRPEIGIAIGEVTLHGQGVGKQALQLALEWLKEQGYEQTHTTILDNNEKAKGLFKSLGYYCVGKAREGESWWNKILTL